MTVHVRTRAVSDHGRVFSESDDSDHTGITHNVKQTRTQSNRFRSDPDPAVHLKYRPVRVPGVGSRMHCEELYLEDVMGLEQHEDE